MTQIIANSESLCEILRADHVRQFPSLVKRYRLDIGRRYIKILQSDDLSVHGSVHAFIDKNTGDVYKPASWAAPAKGVRYNILRDLDLLRGRADWTGGYLYR